MSERFNKAQNDVLKRLEEIEARPDGGVTDLHHRTAAGVMVTTMKDGSSVGRDFWAPGSPILWVAPALKG